MLKPTSTLYISRGVGCPRGKVLHFHVLETLAPFSPSVAPDLAVRRRNSSSHVWIPAEVLYVQHFDDRDRIVGLHCPERRAINFRRSEERRVGKECRL